MVMVAALAAALPALGTGAVFARDGQTGTAKEDGVSVTIRANQRIQRTGVPCVASGNADLVFGNDRCIVDARSEVVSGCSASILG